MPSFLRKPGGDVPLAEPVSGMVRDVRDPVYFNVAICYYFRISYVSQQEDHHAGLSKDVG